MEKFLIDSNIISGYFTNSFSEEALEFISRIIDEQPNISVITKIEALSWVNQDKRKEKIVRFFIEDSNIFGLSKEVADVTIKIRRSRKIRTPDAIIAATAIVNNFTLVSGDNDFIGIQGLKLVNPRELK